VPILPHVNEDYLKRLQDALIEAVLKASIDPKTKVAAVYQGEIVTASIGLIAMFAGTSKGVDTPQKLRLFGEECDKRIRQAIKQVQEHARAGQLPFDTMHADERH